MTRLKPALAAVALAGAALTALATPAAALDFTIYCDSGGSQFACGASPGGVAPYSSARWSVNGYHQPALDGLLSTGLFSCTPGGATVTLVAVDSLGHQRTGSNSYYCNPGDWP
ncbi:hypothetical protein V5P93_005958 [Actinokineospora auranticolor]|uniref:Ig-like domain-containing protein n=1 Tax=Actinokineospora auranticolor TaxID=155976 RepID=A0A2S6GHE4_9PSEU|nr:hypothetical protein [Actinokineospora auranticolor]PPK64652.1 hypothetical protein CLV40_11842 [Actinokineospora auranticolor]